jgi:hypothetical protein
MGSSLLVDGRRGSVRGFSGEESAGTRDGRYVPGAGDGLDDDVVFLDAGGEELGFCAGEERLDDLVGRTSVPCASWWGSGERNGCVRSCSSGHGRWQCAERFHCAVVLRRGPLMKSF